MEQAQQEAYKKNRKYRSTEQIEKCLNEQAKSGLTIKAYCEANGISEKNFYRWTEKYRGRKVKRRKRRQAAAAGFAKICNFLRGGEHHPEWWGQHKTEPWGQVDPEFTLFFNEINFLNLIIS